MKPASAAYRRSMAQNMRNRSYIKVIMFVEDPTAVHDGSWQDNGAVPYSGYGTVDYEYSYGPTYATLELNRWSLDGSQLSLPAAGGYTAQGFVSNKASKDDCTFQTTPMLTRKFSKEHALRGLSLTFDSRCQMWPLTMTVYFLLNNEVVDTVEVQVTSLTAVAETSADWVDEVRIAFTSALPNTRPRVEYILYGIQATYDDNTVSETSQKHDVDPLTRRLPQETARVVLLDYANEYDPDNPTGIFRYIEEKARMRIQHGYQVGKAVEWLRADEYLMEGKPAFADDKATFTASGMVARLTTKFYKSKVGRKSLYDMAEEVLLDADLPLTVTGGHPWDIDDSLKTMFTDAILPLDSHANCLKLIAHAARCTLYTDDENIIHIEPFGVTIRGIYAGVWADNGHTWYSDWDTVDTGNTGDIPFTSLELNRWSLNGTMGIISATAPESRGYVSSGTMGADGNAVVAPVFSKTFDISHDMSLVALQFDNLAHVHPFKVQVRYFKGSELLDTQVVEVLDDNAYIYSDAANDCTKIEVSMLSGLPYQQFRVSKVYYREDDFSLNFETTTEGTLSATKIDKLRAVNVAVYAYTPAAEATKLHESTVSQETLHVEFSNPATDVAISVSGGTLISSNIYGRAADLVLSPGTKTVTVTGKVLETSSVILSHVLSTVGEVDTEENPLITDHDMAQALAEHFTTYLTMRNTYNAEYRGNPELETGDVIGLQTKHTGEMDALILVDEITYDGALSGKMKVKGLI